MKSKLQLLPLDEMNALTRNTLMETLDIKITVIAEDYIEGTMPVDKRTHQAFGILHGGASVLFAEALGTLGAMLTIDRNKYTCTGIDVNANHIKAVRSGVVTGTAKPLHTGRSTQVWQIEIKNETQELVCVCRYTIGVRNKD